MWWQFVGIALMLVVVVLVAIDLTIGLAKREDRPRPPQCEARSPTGNLQCWRHPDHIGDQHEAWIGNMSSVHKIWRGNATGRSEDWIR